MMARTPAVLPSAALVVLAMGVLAIAGCRGGVPSGNDAGGVDARRVEKKIEIDLTVQELRTFEGGRLSREYAISSGRKDRTPPGDYVVWKKHRKKDMKVGLVVLGKFYVLEDVPWIMFFEGRDLPRERGYAIHGAYWHDDFGKPVSHGCVNMRVEDARDLWHWSSPSAGEAVEVVATDANPGTPVAIHGFTPGG